MAESMPKKCETPVLQHVQNFLSLYPKQYRAITNYLTFTLYYYIINNLQRIFKTGGHAYVFIHMRFQHLQIFFNPWHLLIPRDYCDILFSV
jgi:hypothetical protein